MDHMLDELVRQDQVEFAQYLACVNEQQLEDEGEFDATEMDEGIQIKAKKPSPKKSRSPIKSYKRKTVTNRPSTGTTNITDKLYKYNKVSSGRKTISK